MAKRSGSLAHGKRVAKKERRTAAAPAIDFSDIPKASDEQLRAMRRVGRPPIGDAARQLIAIRLDPDVLQRLRAEAKRHKLGYQTLIHRILSDYTRERTARDARLGRTAEGPAGTGRSVTGVVRARV